METSKEFNPVILPRHTYSESNAKRFKNVFDKAFTNKTDEFISCEDAKLKINSLRQRANEALLWLINNPVKNSSLNKEDYKLLRSRIKIKTVSFGTKDGILISWQEIKSQSNKPKEKKDINSISTSTSLKENQGGFIHWKERILSFIKDDNIKDIHLVEEDFQGKLLTDLDVEWITNTLTSAGVEFKIGPNEILAVK